MDAVSHLEAQLAATTNDLSLLSAALALEKKNLNNSRRNEKNRKRMQLEVAYILYVFEWPERKMVKAYLRSCWPDGDANFIEEHMDGIEKRYLAASPESLAHLRNGGCELFAQSRMKKAMAYRRDMLLYSWVEEQNCDLGLTPALKEVYSNVREIVVSLTPDIRAFCRVERGALQVQMGAQVQD